MDSENKYSILLIIILGVVTEAQTKFIKTEAAAMTEALDSVDDQYIGCEVQMLDKVLGKGGLLQKELDKDHDYLEAWNNGRTCRRLIPGAREEHSIALAVFTSDFNFYDKFNDAVSTLGRTVEIYKSKFPYKSLHFLLTDALRILNKTQCYHGSSGTHQNLSLTAVNSVVRLGAYHWGSPFMERFCQTEYKVTSCLAVDVKDYSCFRDIDVIIPPYELFNVTAVDTINDGEKRVITLMSTEKHRKKLQCAYLQSTGTADHVAHSTALVLLAASHFVFLIT